MRGSVFKTKTGAYRLALRLDVTPYAYVDRRTRQQRRADQRQIKRSGFTTQRGAKDALNHINRLVELAGADDQLRRKIGDMVCRARYNQPLPTVEEVQRKLGAGREPDARTYNLGEWLDAWLAECGHLGERARGDYRGHIEYHLKPHIGEVLLDRLDGRHIKAMFDAINARNDVITSARATGQRVQVPYDPLDRRPRAQLTGPNTQRQILKTLKAALYTAMDEDHRLIDRNPAARFRLPRPIVEDDNDDAPERVWWSSEQVGRFLDATHDDRLHALWHVALMCGLRRGELLALRWTDVDLDARTLRVRRGKTPSSRRTVSLNTSTIGALRTHRKRQLEERAATFGAYDDHGLVFCREDGTGIPPHRVTVEFKKRARQHRLPVMRFHDTRHTAASLMLEAGVDIKVVSDMLGHSTTRITLDLYQHVVRRLHDEAADRVEALVGGTRSRAGQHL